MAVKDVSYDLNADKISEKAGGNLEKIINSLEALGETMDGRVTSVDSYEFGFAPEAQHKLDKGGYEAKQELTQNGLHVLRGDTVEEAVNGFMTAYTPNLASIALSSPEVLDIGVRVDDETENFDYARITYLPDTQEVSVSAVKRTDEGFEEHEEWSREVERALELKDFKVSGKTYEPHQSELSDFPSISEEELNGPKYKTGRQQNDLPDRFRY